LQGATAAIKHITGNLDADKVEDIMDDMEEVKQTQDAISEALTRNANMDDDDELMAELDAMTKDMEADLLKESLMAPPPAAATHAGIGLAGSLPEAPRAAIRSTNAASAEDEERKALENLKAAFA